MCYMGPLSDNQPIAKASTHICKGSMLNNADQYLGNKCNRNQLTTATKLSTQTKILSLDN